MGLKLRIIWMIGWMNLLHKWRCVFCVSSSFILRLTQNKNVAIGHPDRNINDDKGLGDILKFQHNNQHNQAQFLVFKDASDLIPVPYVKPVVTIVASLLMAVQVSLWNLVALPTNDYQQTRSNSETCGNRGWRICRHTCSGMRWRWDKTFAPLSSCIRRVIEVRTLAVFLPSFFTTILAIHESRYCSKM